eukprot:SAG31_NODE_21197_length_555_cov_1.541667_2_plen_110_part_01
MMAECRACPDPQMILDGPDDAADAENDCRCPDGTFDSTVYKELRCWPDGYDQGGLPVAAARGAAMNENTGRCIPCPAGCVSCEGGVPRLRPGFNLAQEVVLQPVPMQVPL